MSEEKRELITGVFRDLNRRDWDDLSEAFPPEFEYHSRFAALEGGRIYRGAGGFIEIMQAFLATWQDVQWHFQEIRHVGDRSVVLYRVTGTATESGVPLDQGLALVVDWRGNTPVRAEIFASADEALEAAGLSE